MIDATTQLHQRVLVAANFHWGAGASLQEAVANFRKAGGRGAAAKLETYVFVSELPFAPPDRDATEDEADCYVDQGGFCTWIRCNRVRI